MKYLVFLVSLFIQPIVWAATTTYDFNTRTPGVDAFAYDGELTDNSVPPANNTSPSSQHSSSEYNNIAQNDNIFDLYSVSRNSRRGVQRYVFTIDENKADVNQLSILWRGRGVNSHRSRRDGITLYIWNYANARYQIIDNSNNTSTTNLTSIITTSVDEYIGGSSDNEITLFITSNDKRTGNRANIIYTDYVQLDVDSADGGPGTCAVADNFTNSAYNQNDGSVDWSGDWLEFGEADGPSAGIARIRNDNCSSGNCLRLGVPNGNSAQTYSNIGVSREVNLNGASTATLTFNYRTGYNGGTPLVRLWISNDGGITWFVIQSYSFTSTNFTPISQSVDLTPYIASNTQIRFSAEGAGAVSGFYVDDLQINYDCPTVHHYEIIHDGNGLTCAVEPITIKACSDASCSSTVTDASDVKLSINGSELKTVTVVGGSTSTDFSFPSLTPTPIATLSLDKTFQCTNGASTSCNITFADSEFRFLYGNGNSDKITNQTSGKVFSGLKVQARKNVNGECEGIFNGLVNIKLAQENMQIDPLDTNAGLMFQVNGNDIGKYTTFSNDIELNFTTDNGEKSVAIIPDPAYLDAGKIRLHASYNQGGVSLVGTSNEFWVKPAKFVMSARKTGSAIDINSSSTDNSVVEGKVIHSAGAVFDFSVEALNSLNNRVENYRQTDGQLQIKVQRLLPNNTGTFDGRFTYADGADISTTITPTYSNVALTSFSSDTRHIGLSKYAGAKFAEVGIINVDIQDVNYGGLGSSNGLVQGDDITVGRFTPAYFKQTVNINKTGNLDTKHSELFDCTGLNWAYTGQQDTGGKGAIFYGIKPEIVVTAYNVDGTVTKNYTATNFMKLEPDDFDITAPTHDLNQLRKGEINPNVVDNLVALTASINLGSISNGSSAGEVIYTFSESDHFTYTRDNTSFITPFQAEIPLTINQITDEDGIIIGTDSSNDKFIETVEMTGLEVRFARMVIENTFGPETSNLRVPLNVQTFNGTSFVQASDESCLTPLINAKETGVIYSGNLNLWDYRLFDDTNNPDVIEIGDTNASIANAFVIGEHSDLFFSASQAQGALELEYEVPAWLQFDWQNLDTKNDGPYTDNPTATLNFGLYRGNDRIISWREVTN
jgi:hypothetical protein